MEHKCLLWASFIALLLAWTQEALGDVYALPDGLTQLKGQSYWLKSKLTTLVGGKLCKLESDEFFSSWQRRSRIDYRILTGNYASDWLNDDKIPVNGVILADERNVLLVPKLATGGYCSRISLKLVTKMFTMSALGSDDQQREPRSLIGPSRLLQLIADQVYKLKQADETKITPLETFQKIPNVIKLVFDGLPDGASLTLYYSNNQEQNLAHGVPKEMHLQTADRRIVIYEFQKVALLNQDNFIDLKSILLDGNRMQFQHMTLLPDASQLTFDLFRWNRGGGCSNALRRSQLDDRLDLVGLDRKEFRFSFTAQVNTLSLGEECEMIVGYEPTIATLRVNKVCGDETIESTINYQQMRNYHVIKKNSNQMGELKESSGDLQVTKGGLGALDGGKISCVMTPATAVTARDPLSRGIKLGDMLLGSIKFTYLGRAKVRGIDALMFESPESEWPIWLEPPALIYKGDGLKARAMKQTITRRAGGFISDSEYRLNTVVYLSASPTGAQDQAKGKSDYQEPIALNNKLLMVEFFEFHKKSNELLRTFSVSIYDFAWHIANGGIGNRLYTDFFAIADECPRDDDGPKELARVDLILAVKRAGGNKGGVSKFDGASDDGITDGWLWNDVKRNLAILQAIYQNAKLPSSLVYDFRSRLGSSESAVSDTTNTKDSNTNRLPDGTQVAVSFQMVDHVNHLDELIYIGIGCVKPNAVNKFRRFTLKFRDCTLLAGHQKLETVFGFDPILNHCHIYMRHVFGATLALLVGSTLSMDRENCSPKLEIYQTTRVPVDETDRLSKFEFSAPQKIGLIPVLDDGNEDARAGSPIWYDAELVKIRSSLPNQAIKSGLKLESESRLLPFGLVSTNAMNTAVVANRHDDNLSAKEKKWAETHLQHPINELTFGQCQTQCLVTPDCDAFSFCQRAGRIECALTRANLRSDTSLRKLTQMAMDKSLKFGQIFDVETSPEIPSNNQDNDKLSVTLRKHPACELHFKDYMVLTRRQDVARVTWAHDLSRLKPVKDREECARRCLERTISTLTDEVEPLSRLNAQALKGPDEGGNSLRDLYQQHQAAHSRICSTFLYLDAESCDAKLMERLNEFHVETSQNKTKSSGFCSIAGEESPSDHKGTDLTDSEVVSEKHQIDFSLMYERHFGISLLGSSLTREEKTAFDAVIHSGDKPLTLSDSKLLEAFLARGENHVKYFYAIGDATNCAKACFLAQPVWPACKSFSVEESFKLGLNQPLLTCRMNSVTLSEVLANERYDLIQEQKSPGEIQEGTETGNSTVLYWHYEPRQSFMGRSVDWTAKLQANHDLWDAPKRSTGMSTFSLSALWFLACIFIIMVLGTKLGIALGRRFVTKLETIAEGNENLVNGMVVEHSDMIEPEVELEHRSNIYS